MEHEQKKGLSNARYLHAEECLKEAKALLEIGSYKGAANRSYYAIFHAMRAVLAFDEVDMKHHSGLISEFRRMYIKTGVFDKELSNIISILFNIRQSSDYDDFFIVQKDAVVVQLGNAEHFLNEIRKYLETK